MTRTSIEIEPPYRSALRRAGLDDFDAVMQAAAGPPASRHRHRETVPTLIEVDGAPRRFFLKRVFCIPPKHAVIPWLRLRRGRSQPWREWHALAALERAGVPAMRRVAMGERRRWGRPTAAFLLVEAVDAERTVDAWLAAPTDPVEGMTGRTRRRLVRDLGRMMGKLHAAGFRWRDAVAKHVFAVPCPRSEDGSSWRFTLIDVERMTQARRASNPQRVDALDALRLRDLRMLRDSLRFARFVPRDGLRFLAGYLADQRRPLGPTTRDRCRAFLAESASIIQHLPRRPDDDASARDAPYVRCGGGVRDERERGWLDRVRLATMDDVFACRAGEALEKPGLDAHRARTRLTLCGNDGASRVVYLKRYQRPPWREQLRRIVGSRARRSTAWREAHSIRRLWSLGVPTMRLLAYGEDMRGCWERRSYLLTQAVDGESLERLASRAAEDRSATPRWRDRRDVIEQLAKLARLLHHHELYHRDFYLSHVLLGRNAAGDAVLHLIDLARMIERPMRHLRWRIKDLAALDHSAPSPLVTRSDRMRFWYHYWGEDDAARPDVRDVQTRVRARVRRMARHDANAARRRQRRMQA